MKQKRIASAVAGALTFGSTVRHSELGLGTVCQILPSYSGGGYAQVVFQSGVISSERISDLEHLEGSDSEPEIFLEAPAGEQVSAYRPLAEFGGRVWEWYSFVTPENHDSILYACKQRRGRFLAGVRIIVGMTAGRITVGLCGRLVEYQSPQSLHKAFAPVRAF